MDVAEAAENAAAAVPHDLGEVDVTGHRPMEPGEVIRTNQFRKAAG